MMVQLSTLYIDLKCHSALSQTEGQTDR